MPVRCAACRWFWFGAAVSNVLLDGSGQEELMKIGGYVLAAAGPGRMGQRRWLAALAWLLLIQLAACTGLTKKPEISLDGIELVGLGLVEQRFVLKLSIDNPNAVDLSIKALRYDLELNGSHFAQGASEQALVVPGHGKAVLEVMSVSRLATVLRQMREARREGREQVAFRLYGQAEVAGLGSLAFERRGEIPALRLDKLLPKARPNTP
jgi:LEA14-like dessication related protein